MGRLSYAGAMASVLVVGVTTIGVMMPAVQRSDKQVAVTPPARSENEWVRLDNAKPQFALDNPALQTAPAGYVSVTSQPRYIMDARPVSYEASSF